MRFFSEMSDGERRLLIRVGHAQREMRKYKGMGADGKREYNTWKNRLRRLWKAIDAL